MKYGYETYVLYHRCFNHCYFLSIGESIRFVQDFIVFSTSFIPGSYLIYFFNYKKIIGETIQRSGNVQEPYANPYLTQMISWINFTSKSKMPWPFLLI